MQAIAKAFSGRARVVQVQWDRQGRVGGDFESSGLPDYLVFRDGKRVDRLRFPFVDLLLEARLRWMLEAALESGAP